MKELQILQNEAAKLILDRPLHPSSTDALKVLRWLNLEECRKCHRCIYEYKCMNGQLEHSLDIVPLQYSYQRHYKAPQNQM